MQMAATQAQVKSPEKNTSRKGKSVKNSGKGKALKRKTSESVELPSGSRVTVSPKKRKGKPKVQTKTTKPKARKTKTDNTELIKSLFQGLTDSLRSTLTGNTQRHNSLQRTRQNNETARTENNHNDQYSDQEEESDYPVYGTCNNNIENGNFSIFSDDGNCNDQSEVSSDENNEFDYELPRIFEGDERFGEEVCESISKVCDNICKKKTDVSTMVNDLKVPSNCKSLVVPPVNPEIWQFLYRKTKSSDLGLQNLQRLLAYGMIPVITLAGILKTKKPDIRLMREAVSKAMTVLCNTHFELSVKRKLMLKPYIDRKFHQLCNKNKKLVPISLGEVIVTGGRGRYPYNQSQGRFLGRRGYSRGHGSQRAPYSNRGQQVLKVSSRKIKTAGILKKNISKWKTLTHDKWVFSTVMGHKIEFDKKPFQGKIPTPIKFNDTAINLIQEEVSELLSKGAIKEVRHGDAESFSTSVINTKKVQQFIQSVGFNINIEKSVFIPSQRITFLGYIIDSVLFRVFLPEDKIQKIIEISNNVLKPQNILIRHVAQLVGLYSSARYAVTHAHLFHRYLDIDKTRALIKSNKNYNANMIISEERRSYICWWLANVNSENGKLIREDPPSHSLHTDSSMKGWGAFLDKTSCSTQGRWNLDEQNLHINVLELKAIYFGLISLCYHIKDAHVRSDQQGVDEDRRRSAICQTLTIIGNKNFDNNYFIKRFLKGIFNMRPPVARYNFTWDVGQVLKYLGSVYPLNDLSLKMVTMKSVALVALAIAQRSQTLRSLNLKPAYCSDKSIVFKIGTLLKTSRPKNLNQEITVASFCKPEMCPLKTLKHYILRTQNVRKSNKFLTVQDDELEEPDTVVRYSISLFTCRLQNMYGTFVGSIVDVCDTIGYVGLRN
ncbi:unnamed protein product [Mytilus coruscus]|uniref:Reverse transcriptase domain-containing protein n=1 Tax=Mytilus coruscus TaxID=42192 RepID=A0A6J8BVP8_MYTCO|nr:unnamed protein product [Mytilus coruscus]